MRAKFDEPVLMSLVTLLQDWITSLLLPSVAAVNMAHFIAVCRYWTRY